ncbi:hypothetical protein [Streptomyces sp. NBC_01186]|uniref:hypothetical protein n=1 Tax=Streptomyces sp. NBC_01186 TaxID=2903765 RepID=UPI003FA7717B
MDGEARIAQLTDRAGHSITFEYDAETGTPTRLVHSGGYEVKLTVEDERVTALLLGHTDGPDSTVKRYGYTEGDLTEVTNSSGLPLRFEYDDERSDRPTGQPHPYRARRTQQDRCRTRTRWAGRLPSATTRRAAWRQSRARTPPRPPSSATSRAGRPSPATRSASPRRPTYVHNPHAVTDVLGLAPKCGPSLKDRLKGLFGKGGGNDAPAPEPPREPLALPPGRPDIGELATLHGPFHRKGSPTQTPDVAQQVVDSSELWGRVPRNAQVEAAQAHVGPIPPDAGAGSFEFYTSSQPTGISYRSGYATWDLGGEGVGHVFHNGEDFARIPVFVREVR